MKSTSFFACILVVATSTPINAQTVRVDLDMRDAQALLALACSGDEVDAAAFADSPNLKAQLGHHSRERSGEWETWTTEDGLPENEVRAVFEDSKGNLWFGTRSGLGVFDGESWTYYTTDDGLVSNGIATIVEDRDGNIWTAGRGGYSTFDGNAWVGHDSLGALQPRVVFSINLDSRGHLWFGANGGASALTDQGWQHYTQADGLPHQVVHEALKDRNGNVWSACRRGLAQWVEGEMRVHYPESNFGSILEDDSGSLWFGTRASGVYQFDGEQWIQHLPGLDARPSFIDKAGTIWAVSDDAGVYAYDGETWASYGIVDGLASDTVYDVFQAKDGNLWFATAEGATRYRP